METILFQSEKKSAIFVHLRRAPPGLKYFEIRPHTFERNENTIITGIVLAWEGRKEGNTRKKGKSVVGGIVQSIELGVSAPCPKDA
jgi:hypothetical protein